MERNDFSARIIDESEKTSLYSEEMFIVILQGKEGEEAIDTFCNEIFRDILFEDRLINYVNIIGGFNNLKSILLSFPRPFTIIQEFYHIDRWYRDSYYTYFSNQHFSIKRHSRRLSFFKGEINENQFFLYEENGEKNSSDEIQKSFIGTCVLNPLISGIIGTTLIDPIYVLNKDKLPAYMRLSKFKQHIYGRELSVNAFPFRMQDGETMRCAEVTLINIVDYFSNQYNDYRQIVPSEILKIEQKHNHERALPSQGMTYPMLTKVMSEIGFSPRLYNLSSINTFGSSGISRKDVFRRLLHYYIESGIPVALGLFPDGNSSGHSIVCIGHGDEKEECKQNAYDKRWISWERKTECHPLIDSADYYDEYVVVDDNQPVYQKRVFDELSLYGDLKVVNMTVPLYKRMFLDAVDAASIMRSILQDEKYGIDQWAGNYLEKGEDVVMRIFMASSKSLKQYRVRTLNSIYAKKAFVITPMPRFVWVCELYKVSEYAERNAFGEIILDATSASTTKAIAKSLIWMHYPHTILFRSPNQENAEFDQQINLEDDSAFKGYESNLTKISE